MYPRWNDRNHRRRQPTASGRAGRRTGLTLVELLIAMSIVVLVVGSLGALAKAVQSAFEYGEGYAAVTQHARVVMDRITRTVRAAPANGQFPGAISLAEWESSWRFPDTLVVWSPSGAPADPDGLPRFNELVIYCPDPSLPNTLLEITVPDDARPVPAVDNEPQWAAEIQAIKEDPGAQRIVLTDLMRACAVTESSDSSWRGAVRFETLLRPSASDLDRYLKGEVAWKDLPWVQGIFGVRTGLRQTWVRIELQLVPNGGTIAPDAAPMPAVPFFGSAAVYYTMRR